MERRLEDGAAAVYRIALGSSFLSSLKRCPEKVIKAFEKSGFERLRHHAEHHDGQSIKKLSGHSGHWRLRLCDDYRIIYEVCSDTVTLLKAGNRRDIYEGRVEQGLSAATGPKEPRRPHGSGKKRPTEARWFSATPPPESASQPALLPMLTAEQLHHLAIGDPALTVLLGCRTEDELLGAAVEPEILERVLEELYPPSILKEADEPTRIVESFADIRALVAGTRTLTDFLLKLDPEQERVLARFEGDDPKGPLIIKGGPGSGKSTLALYCAGHLVSPRQRQLSLEARPQVLFVTYTNSLIRTSRSVLAQIVPDLDASSLRVCTVHSEAARLLSNGHGSPRILNSHDLGNCLGATLEQPRLDGGTWQFSRDDVDYLTKEIEWLILGNGIETLDDYLRFQRFGRGRPLREAQRRQVWDLMDQARERVRRTHDLLGFEDLIRMALPQARGEYDYVFIDEAQDLTPNAIRLCVALAKYPERIYLTADLNQSIYGRGVSWSSVSTSLRFPGRTVRLEHNYRCTRQIFAAASELMSEISDSDRETLESSAIYCGPKPVLQYFESPEHEIERLVEYLENAIADASVGIGSAVALVRDRDSGIGLARRLPTRLKARFMSSRDFEPDHDGLAITTIHAAKGLEYPVVVVVDVSDGVFPPSRHRSTREEVMEERDNELRLLHVACSRASRSLMLMTSKARPSPFLACASPDSWDIRHD